MAPIDKFNGNLVNGFLFGGKKIDKEETATTAKAKTNETLPLVAPANTTKVDKTNLNLDMNAVLGLHLTKTAQTVDTSEKATAARAAEFYASADFQAFNKEFNIYDDIDPAIGEFLSPKTLAYVAKTTPEARERIGTGVTNYLDTLVS